MFGRVGTIVGVLDGTNVGDEVGIVVGILLVKMEGLEVAYTVGVNVLLNRRSAMSSMKQRRFMASLLKYIVSTPFNGVQSGVLNEDIGTRTYDQVELKAPCTRDETLLGYIKFVRFTFALLLPMLLDVHRVKCIISSVFTGHRIFNWMKS